MTRSRIFASETRNDPVILSDSEDQPEVSQELTPKEGATVPNPNPNRHSETNTCKKCIFRLLSCISREITTL